MWKHIKFFLSGGLPSIAHYEQKQALLRVLYEQYETLRQSVQVQRYQELSAQVATPRRQSGLTKSEFKALKKEHSTLRKDAKVVLFFSMQKKTHSFKELVLSEEFFYEDFSTAELDPLKWTTRRPAADQRMPEIQYSPAEDEHLFSVDGENVALSDSSLKIITRREPAEGLAFSSKYGFVTAKREFTSGIVNTGDGCRLLYGTLEIKFRFNSTSNHVYHTIWMSGGRRLPHINVVRVGKKVEMGAFAHTDGSENIVQHTSVWRRGLLKPNTYYALRLVWSEECMEWYINGRKIFAAPNIVREPMFLAFSSGIAGGEPNTTKPSLFEIKIVRINVK